MPGGDRISYLTLEAGTDVLGSDGERVGVVEYVMRDDGADIFTGIVVDTRLGPGGLHFADATQVAEIRTDAVVLTVRAEEARQLPKPPGRG
jgi:hypothetical protein